MDDQKTFALSVRGVNDNASVEEPPPAYTALSQRPLPTTIHAVPHPNYAESRYNFTNMSLKPYDSPPSHTRILPLTPEESLEVIDQLLRIISRHAQNAINMYPHLRGEILGNDPTHTCHIVPKEAVPLFEDWHSTQASDKDDMLRGEFVSMARIRAASKREAVPGEEDKQPDIQTTADGVHIKSEELSARDAFLASATDWSFSTLFTDGLLWFNDENRAKRLARTLTNTIHKIQRTGAHASSFDVLPGRNYPTPVDSVPFPAHLSLVAEYTTFRREDEMGLWQSKSGWAIVARVTAGDATL